MAGDNNDAFSADVANDAYWAAAEDGKLLLKTCGQCKETYYYPRPICPFCMSDDTQWCTASGEGTVYSWSVERRADPPFAIAFVSLAEGPTLLTNLVDCDLDQISIGQSVRLRFETRDGAPVPVFSPV